MKMVSKVSVFVLKNVDALDNVAQPPSNLFRVR